MDTIYDASLDPSGWPGALAAFTDAIGGHGAYLYAVAADRSVPFSIRCRLPGSMEEEYAAHYIHACPRLGYILQHPEITTIYDSMIMSEREMDRHEYFAWLASYGFRYMIGSRLYQEPGEQLFIGVQRTRDAGHVDQTTIEHYNMLTAHLSRALKISKELGQLRHRVTALEGLADGSVFGILFVEAAGQVVYVNKAAKSILDADDGLKEANGTLIATAGERESLGTLIRRAVSEVEVLGAPWSDTVRIARPSGRRPYLVRAVPLRGERFVELRGRAKVAIFITDLETSIEEASAVIGRAFRLTPTEARIAAGLAEGRSVADMADRLGMSERTARLHLEHIFFKTETHKQHELVRLLLLTTFGCGQL